MYVYQCLWWKCWFQWVHVKYIYWHNCLISTHECIGIYVAFEGHICCCTSVTIAWKIRAANCCFVLLICAVKWNIYVDYSSCAVEHIYTVWYAYLFWIYVNNVKCMHTRVYVHIVDCSGLIQGIYTNMKVSYVQMHSLVHVAYMWHLRDKLAFGTYMAITCFLSCDGDGAIN